MQKKHLFLLGICVLVLIWSGIEPKDYLTWLMEVAPGVAGLGVLIFTYKRFKFTDLTYVLIVIHCCILFYGGKYTYAENPLFDWLKEVFSWERNHYDKLGHFVQGFVPSIIAREVILRLGIVKNRKWLFFFILSITMFISSMYELIEWWAALLIGQSADAFLGMQGYVWDTQSDMFYAFVGSLTALIFLSKIHDRLIHKLQPPG